VSLHCHSVKVRLTEVRSKIYIMIKHLADVYLHLQVSNLYHFIIFILKRKQDLIRNIF